MRVLIVEDEPLLEMVLEDTVVSAGHEVIGWATNCANALALGDARSPEIAFVDLRLWDGDTGLELSHRLSERGIAVVVTTAYSSDHVGELDHALSVVPKPYTAETIQAALRHAGERLESSDVRPGPLLHSRPLKSNK